MRSSAPHRLLHPPPRRRPAGHGRLGLHRDRRHNREHRLVQHADGTEEVLTGTRATTTVPADKQAVIIAVVTDNQGKETFTTQPSPTIG